MEILKFIGIALSGVVLSVVLKQYKSEYRVLISLACGILLFVLSLGYIGEIFSGLSDIAALGGINGGFFSLMLKAVGIACLCEIGVNLCRDAGESAIGSKLEFAGKLILLALSLPVFFEVLSALTALLR
ncbi:MAG: stage III sporulation protein AD [Clostridia bacterium]|nr:stage III sporulation protein AD [Clostridia bacterium]